MKHMIEEVHYDIMVPSGLGQVNVILNALLRLTPKSTERKMRERCIS